MTSPDPHPHGADHVDPGPAADIVVQRSVYVVHDGGHLLREYPLPWIAPDAGTAIITLGDQPRSGQPLFTTAEDAFVFLRWARRRLVGDSAAIAHVDVPDIIDHALELSVFPAATDAVRRSLRPGLVGAATCQVLRREPGGRGPDRALLTGCFATANQVATHIGANRPIQSTTDDSTRGMDAIWAYGYTVAGLDAYTTQAARVAEQARGLAATAASRDEQVELHLIAQAATTISAAPTIYTPDLPNHIRAEIVTHPPAWRSLSVWRCALRAGAATELLQASTDIAALWRTTPGSRPRRTHIQGVPAHAWLSDVLNHVGQSVMSEWDRAIPASPHSASPPRLLPPTASRAYLPGRQTPTRTQRR
jgi:hypothetical protein